MRQCDAAKALGVSRQAVSQRIQELRGKTTKVVVSKKLEEIVDRKIDAIEQLQKINDEANRLLDALDENPELKLKIMAEIRGQLKLQLDIFEAIFSLQAAEEFQNTILKVIGEVDPNVRNEIIRRINEERSVRGTVRLA
jgi:predicted transcriptional regulator